MNNVTGYYHGQTKEGHRFTLATNSTKTKDEGIKFIASIAICSGRDGFKKDFGRKVASARLEKGQKVTSFTFDTHRDMHEYVCSKSVAELTSEFSLNKSK